jgi:hypothetical protein
MGAAMDITGQRMMSRSKVKKIFFFIVHLCLMIQNFMARELKSDYLDAGFFKQRRRYPCAFAFAGPAADGIHGARWARFF